MIEEQEEEKKGECLTEHDEPCKAMIIKLSKEEI